MPAPIPVPLRQSVCHRWRRGEDVATIATALQLSERTVRHLIQRVRLFGEKGLKPSYAASANKSLPTSTPLYQQAMYLRQLHPTWGGGLIRVLLSQEFDTCPAERTLQRWFRRGGLQPAPPGRRPAGCARRAQQPHEVWQMDAAEKMSLRSGQRVSWLRLVDECSGAVLRTVVSPPRTLGPS